MVLEVLDNREAVSLNNLDGQMMKKSMEWNVDDIAFLHPPDTFTGQFGNAKMQERHESQMQAKLDGLKSALAGEQDPLKAMEGLHKKDHYPFFANNKESFHSAGRFEQALLKLYCRRHGPFSSGGDIPLWRGLFDECDKARLYELGDPVTFATAVVYRGSTLGPKRSLSWSLARERALWFAERWDDPVVGGGTIYELTVPRDKVLIQMRKSRESEVILATSFLDTADIRVFKP